MKKTTHYGPVPRNSRAVCQIASWLTACNIPNQLGENGIDVVVKTHDGKDVNVVVLLDENDPAPSDAVRILSSTITQRDRSKALDTFHQLTKMWGYGTPKPVNRGPDPGKNLCYKNEFELVAMRHSQFRRVNNPTAEQFAYYRPTMEKAVHHFMRYNHKMCKWNMLEFNDLMTYALVYTSNYLGLFRILKPSEGDNERLLYTYLLQKFAEFAGVLLKKGRNCYPDYETCYIAMPKYSMEPLQKEKPQKRETIKQRKLRKSEAVRILAEKLATFTHEQLLETLVGVIESKFQHPDARKEAARQLKLHQKNCNACIYLKIPNPPIKPEFEEDDLSIFLEENEEPVTRHPFSSSE